MEHAVRTPDGRTLAVEESGDPAGRPVLVHMGTPNSRHLYGPNMRDAAARGLRLISYDRPGYGGSSPRPGRIVADCAGDVRAICAELGIDRLAMWGISGGGPHVLACAALLPDLVSAAASLASPAPYGAEGLDYFVGMGRDNEDGFRLFFTDEAAARKQTDEDREEALATPPEDFAKMIESLLSPADAAVLRGELAEYLTSSERDGLAPGSQGWWDDNCTLRPWGFDVAAITVPVLLLHGRQDRFVPFGHGEWLAAHIPGVEARLLDDDGHLTLLQNRVPDVHAWLAEHLQLTVPGPHLRSAPVMAHDIAGDIRLDPRVKAFLAEDEAGPEGDVDSREALLAEANSEEARAGAEGFRQFMERFDTEEAAPSAGLRIHAEKVSSQPDGNTINLQ